MAALTENVLNALLQKQKEIPASALNWPLFIILCIKNADLLQALGCGVLFDEFYSYIHHPKAIALWLICS